MGEILGLGLTHYPTLATKADPGINRIKAALQNPALPQHLRTPAGWPERMRQEWGSDEGETSARQHRQAMVDAFRHVKRILDDFAPDFVVMWGDDQYENFKEDGVPAFTVMAYDRIEARPWASENHRPNNSWDEPEDKTFTIPGHRAGGKFLARQLLTDGFDVAYAYKPLHHELGHAFMNTVMYLDWDRKGWDHPLVPFAVNCIGSRLISQRGGVQANVAEGEDLLDPPGPQPWRCFDLGASTVRALAESPWRVALIASSSWSHGFLTPKNHFFFPDVESDKVYFEALQAGNYDFWRNTNTTQIEDRGHQELLNWFCLVGAMAELGRKPTEATFYEKYIGHCKCVAVFNP